jgi:hypothetical protein
MTKVTQILSKIEQGDSAEILGIPRTTAKRYWSFARAWLLAELHDGADA